MRSQLATALADELARKSKRGVSHASQCSLCRYSLWFSIIWVIAMAAIAWAVTR